MLAGIWLLLTRTRIGLVIQAALTHPETVEALGHNVPRVFMLVFGGGCALAGLAGVIGGNTFVTEPAMAGHGRRHHLRGGGGRRHGLAGGAFLASLLIGLIQTFAVALDQSLMTLFGANFSYVVTPETFGYPYAQAHDFAGGAHPAFPVPGADPDLPAQGPARYAGRMRRRHVTLTTNSNPITSAAGCCGRCTRCC
jgi:hypothetical protein